MSITVDIHGAVVSILLSGGIDYSTQENVRNAIEKALSAGQTQEIHVDFGGVTFMDSSGIRALVVLHKKASEQGKTLVLKNCSKSIRELFEIGGFDQMFTIA